MLWRAPAPSGYRIAVLKRELKARMCGVIKTLIREPTATSCEIFELLQTSVLLFSIAKDRRKIKFLGA